MLRLLLCALAAGVGVYGQSPAPEAAAADAMLGRYCVGCHNDKLKTAGVSVTGVHTADAAAKAATLERVLRKVRTGEMPPLGLPKPEEAVRASFVTFLESQLDQASAAKPDPGAPAIHRLNRAEYSNAVRDLLALDLDHSASLPADDSGYGFDNIGGALTVSPLHMEKYMSTARRVSRLAVGTVKPSPAIERFNAGRGGTANTDGLPLAERNGIVFKRYFPVDADYTILVRVRGNPAPNAPPAELDLRIDGKRAKLFDVAINPAEEAQGTRNYELRLPMKAGMHTLGAGFLSEFWKVEGGPVAGRRGAPAPQFTAPAVDYVQIGGPNNPTGPGDTESRRRIFICRPAAGQPEEPCANRILTSLARQAYRRPVGPSDLAPLMKLYASGRGDGGSFETGIETGLRAILVSPDFLFRVERDPADAAPGAVHRVSDLDLASRLSFFLWSSIPDEELLKLAEQGKLHDQAVLRQQVSRMLCDAKSQALVANFAGQWLRLRNISEWKPDPEKFPQFDDALRNAMRRESELFFDYIIHEDRSVLDLLDADYTFVNERLARHYGIDGVRGNYFRRVQVAGPERGGILTQAGILMVTAYPTRTSPVLRGKWILESLLGAPPPPPPPDVPQLEESTAGSPKNLREQLEKHRANIACATCHVRMDPLGFALENYDPVGKFRTKDGDVEIDASGSLPNGTNVTGPAGLKKVLLEHKDQFVECLADKLLTYALGRGLEYYDAPAVRQIRRDAARNDYRLSSLVLAIVNSEPFQMRRTPD